jgi:hypothetical protein
MVNCLAGCIKDYAEGTLFDNIPDNLSAQNFSPYIKADLISAGIGITVGNKSYPYRKNKAIIKSINFGFGDSVEGSIEIIDEEGGSFALFMDYLLKCPKDSEIDRSIIKLQVGWTTANCNNFSKRTSESPIVESIIIDAQTSISNGLIRFTLNFSSKDKILQNSREAKIFGEEVGGRKMKLNDAIDQLAAIEPRLQVIHARYNDDGRLQILPEGHKWSPVEEPKTSWQTDNLDRYSVIQKWIESYRVNNGGGEKGILVTHSLLKPDVIYLLEDPGEIGEGSNERQIGTFIANGGNCSGVLEFSPSVNFTAPMPSKAVGGSTNPMGSENELKRKQKEKNELENTGTQQTIVISQQAIATMGREASVNVNKSQNKHSEANQITDINFEKPIEAELKIVGTTDQRFWTSVLTGLSIGIVVINPFHIQEKNNDCGDFLRTSSCHPIFSSKKWKLMGITHVIQEGSFVTTLKVMLPPESLPIKTNC